MYCKIRYDCVSEKIRKLIAELNTAFVFNPRHAAALGVVRSCRSRLCFFFPLSPHHGTTPPNLFGAPLRHAGRTSPVASPTLPRFAPLFKPSTFSFYSSFISWLPLPTHASSLHFVVASLAVRIL